MSIPIWLLLENPAGVKLSFLLKILADIRKTSEFKTNFIFFDYKGDVSQNREFHHCN